MDFEGEFDEPGIDENAFEDAEIQDAEIDAISDDEEDGDEPEEEEDPAEEADHEDEVEEEIFGNFGTCVKSRRIPTNARTANRRMTSYERAAYLGRRATQIAQAAPVMSDLTLKTHTPLQIAQDELRNGKGIFVVRRNFPGSVYEDWDLNELKLGSNDISPARHPQWSCMDRLTIRT
jgi:DNA-directed RNA polymerase subunit K/omega